MFDEEYERVIHPRRVSDIYLYTSKTGDNVYRIAEILILKPNGSLVNKRSTNEQFTQINNYIFLLFLKDQCQWYNQKFL